MVLIDVNVLIYAFRQDSLHHELIKRWLEDRINDEAPFAVSDLVFSGVLRVLTHTRIFRFPSTLKDALAFIATIRDCPNFVPINPGPRHWEIFVKLCQDTGAKGSLISDAYHAAVAIEHGVEWVSVDRDFARFTGLRWKNPLDGVR